MVTFPQKKQKRINNKLPIFFRLNTSFIISSDDKICVHICAENPRTCVSQRTIELVKFSRKWKKCAIGNTRIIIGNYYPGLV